MKTRLGLLKKLIIELSRPISSHGTKRINHIKRDLHHFNWQEVYLYELAYLDKVKEYFHP